MEPGPGGFHRDHFGSDYDYDNRVALHEQRMREDSERAAPSGSPGPGSETRARPWTGLPVAMRLTELERWLTEREDVKTAEQVLKALPELWTPKVYAESTDEEMERLARLVRRIARLQPSIERTLTEWEADWAATAKYGRSKADEVTARVLKAKAAVEAAKATRPVGWPLLDPVAAAPPRRSLLARLRASMCGEEESAPLPTWTNLPSLEHELEQAQSEREPEESARLWEAKAARLSRFMEAYGALT